jgi:tetratricopeptide (TPR) repeat protein
MKQRVLLHGNCQGAWLASVLNRMPEVSAEYEVVYMANFGEIPADHPVHQPDFLKECTCVIWQTASGFKPPELLASLPAGCRQIRFPTLWLKLLWPTYTVDPRNKPEAGFPYGRHPYADRLVLKLVNEGVPPDEVPKRYLETDLNKLVNLDRFAEMCMAELKFNDQQSDIAVAPLIEDAFRKVKLFGCINHPTVRILDRLRWEVADALLETPAAPGRPELSNAADVLGPEEIPVHPQLIEHFKLEWAFPGMRWRYHSAFITLEEFVRALATFDAIPLGDSPQIWFGRAEQAFGQGDTRDAERLLREGMMMFPEHVDFFQCLGVMLAGQNRFAEAAYVCRMGIVHHPVSAALRNELGVALFRQGLASQAVAVFEEALRIDPGHEDARANLAVAAQERDRTVPLDFPASPGRPRFDDELEAGHGSPAP